MMRPSQRAAADPWPPAARVPQVVYRQGDRPHPEFDSLLLVRSGQAAMLVDPAYAEGCGRRASVDPRACSQVRAWRSSRQRVGVMAAGGLAAWRR